MRPWPQGRTGWALWKRGNSWEFSKRDLRWFKDGLLFTRCSMAMASMWWIKCPSG
jgi:hypothetical protein